jgi:hypothetical protein
MRVRYRRNTYFSSLHAGEALILANMLGIPYAQILLECWSPASYLRVVYVSPDQFDRNADRVELYFRYNKWATALCPLNKVDRFALVATRILAHRMTKAILIDKTAAN